MYLLTYPLYMYCTVLWSVATEKRESLIDFLSNFLHGVSFSDKKIFCLILHLEFSDQLIISAQFVFAFF